MLHGPVTNAGPVTSTGTAIDTDAVIDTGADIDTGIGTGPIDGGDDNHRPTVIGATGFNYFPIAFFARFPFAMMVVGALTLVVAARDSIALAGINSAVVGLGGAIGGPLLGAAADRFGQRPVLLIAGTLNGIAMIGLAAVAYSSLPVALLLTVSVVTGATAPQAGPLSRSRLVQIIARTIAPQRRLRTTERTMAYESAADEFTFVFGPVLVGVLATTMGAAATMIGAAALTFIFVTAFALHRSADVDAHSGQAPIAPAPVRALFSGRVMVLVAGALAVGLIFGTVLTSLTAYMGDRGNSDAAGLVYGVLGVGSAILALSCALLPDSFTQRARWPFFASLMLCGAIAFGLSNSFGSVIVAIGLTGLGAGPTIVTLYSLAAERAPLGRYSTVMTMLGSATIVGQALASAVTGQIAGNVSTAASMWMPAVAAAAVLGTGLINALAVTDTERQPAETRVIATG